MPIRSLPVRPSLELDKKAAKRLLRDARQLDPAALARIAEHHPRFTKPQSVPVSELRLADIELVLAREYGFPSWPRYKHFVEALLADRATRAATLTKTVCSNQLARGVALLEREPDLAQFDFHTACACGELSFVQRALGKEPALATRAGGVNGWQPLVYVCFSRFLRRDPERAVRLVEIARVLIAHGADADAHYVEEHDGKRQAQTCLYGAAGIANNAELTALLLAAGADVDELVLPPRHGEPPSKSPFEALYHASEFKDVGCLRLLLEAKPTAESVSYCLGRALDFDNEAAALLYLEHGADPNHVVPWNEHRSKLHKAVFNGRSEATIRALLEAGADPNLADDAGVTPYLLAVRGGEEEIALLLEKFGANRASASERDRAIGALVTGKAGEPRGGAVPDARLLMRAARRNDLQAIARLLEAGVDVNAAVDLPPLHAACYAGHLAAARLIFSHGASLTQESAYGGTPLATCIYGSLDCCDAEGGPSTLLPEEVPARDYAELTEWLIDRGSELPKSIWGGSEAVQEVLRRHGVPDTP
jgi:ankyrin repeat protein